LTVECRFAVAVFVMGSSAKPLQSQLEKENEMQYMLLIYGDEKAWNDMSEDEIKATMQAYGGIRPRF